MYVLSSSARIFPESMGTSRSKATELGAVDIESPRLWKQREAPYIEVKPVGHGLHEFVTLLNVEGRHSLQKILPGDDEIEPRGQGRHGEETMPGAALPASARYFATGHCVHREEEVANRWVPYEPPEQAMARPVPGGQKKPTGHCFCET